MKTRRLWVLCSVFFWGWVLVVSFGCLNHISPGQASNPANAETTEVSNRSIKLGCSYDWAGWWPWAVAQKQNLFIANGARIELQWFDDYYAALDAMAAGLLDANCQVLNDTIERAESAVNGEVIVLVTDNSDGNDKIIAAEAIESLPALTGQRIGVEEGKLTDFLLTLALENEGLDRDAVDIRYLSTTAAARAFVAGQLDAVVAWQPDWLMALTRPGSRELLTSQDLPGAIPQVIAVSQTAIEQRADQVQSLIDTWFETLRWMDENPETAREVLLERSMLSEADYALFTEGVHIFSPEENRAAFSAGENLSNLFFTAQKAADFLINVGQISQSPDLTALFDDRFIRGSLKSLHIA